VRLCLRAPSQMPSNFASPCWECYTSTKNATKRCREEKEHKDCDWKDDDRYREQQEKKAKRPSESSFISPLHSRSTLGGGAVGRLEDGHAGARRYLCFVCRLFKLNFCFRISSRSPSSLVFSLVEAAFECVVKRALFSCPIAPFLTHLNHEQPRHTATRWGESERGTKQMQFKKQMQLVYHLGIHVEVLGVRVRRWEI